MGRESFFSVYVGNLSTSTTLRELNDLFRAFSFAGKPYIVEKPGDVTYGFVRLRRRDDALSVVRQFNGRLFKGRRLLVEVSRDCRERRELQNELIVWQGSPETPPAGAGSADGDAACQLAAKVLALKKAVKDHNLRVDGGPQVDCNELLTQLDSVLVFTPHVLPDDFTFNADSYLARLASAWNTSSQEKERTTPLISNKIIRAHFPPSLVEDSIIESQAKAIADDNIVGTQVVGKPTGSTPSPPSDVSNASAQRKEHTTPDFMLPIPSIPSSQVSSQLSPPLSTASTSSADLSLTPTTPLCVSTPAALHSSHRRKKVDIPDLLMDHKSYASGYMSANSSGDDFDASKDRIQTYPLSRKPHAASEGEGRCVPQRMDSSARRQTKMDARHGKHAAADYSSSSTEDEGFVSQVSSDSYSSPPGRSRSSTAGLHLGIRPTSGGLRGVSLSRCTGAAQRTYRPSFGSRGRAAKLLRDLIG